MSAPEYTTDYAKSGLSKCKASGEKIEKGTFRIGKIVIQDRDGEPIHMTQWFLPIPFFQMMSRMRKKEYQLAETSDVSGFDDLKEEDQTAFAKWLDDFKDPDVDFPPKPPKKEKAKKKEAGDDDEEKPKAKKAKVERPAIEEETRDGIEGKEAMVSLANELVQRCRERGLEVSTDDDAARKKMAVLLLASKSGSTVDVAAVIAAAEKEYGVRKTVECACDANTELALCFVELASFEFKQSSTMKALAYKKVAAALAEHGTPITSGKEAMKLKGVGKSSGAKIDEFLANGSIATLEDYKNAS